MKNKEKEIQKMKDRIDAYNNTVYAIIGFLNTYKHELRDQYPNINIFQGRKLGLDGQAGNYVTPDLGLTLNQEHGLVGEVKYSFPLQKSLWKNDFMQLKKYDRIGSGWTTSSGNIKRYEIVLLVQQSRSRSVKDYYLQEVEQENRLTNNFVIIEFNRSSQGREYFHFRIEHGKLSHQKIHDRLYNGLPVPMDVFVRLYAKIKIYDAEPPLPLLLSYLYECVVDKQVASGRFKKMTKKNKQTVFVTVQEMTAKLNAVYSFKSLYAQQYTVNQPEYPRQDWVRNAMEHLIDIGEGNWLNKTEGEFNYLLTQKEGNILDHYIRTSVSHQTYQPSLF